MDGEVHKMDGKWDLLIAHPTCTFLSNVATRQYSLKCCPPEKVIARWEERARAAVFFMRFANFSVKNGNIILIISHKHESLFVVKLTPL